MSKKPKLETHHILFKGRFIVKEDQVNPDVAYKLASRCNKKKKSLVKTRMKIHENGFTIGNKSGLRNIRKLWFYFQDLKHFYIFEPFSNAVVIVNKMKDVTYMSYFEFDHMIGLERLTKSIEKSKGTPEDQISNHSKDDESNKYDSMGSEKFDQYTNNGFEDENENDAIQPAPLYAPEESRPEDVMDGKENPNWDESDSDNGQDKTDFGFSSDDDEEDNLDKDHAMIDNGFHSVYIDLFADNNEGTPFDDPKKRMSKIVHGSVFIFSQNFVAPGIDLYGVCEEDDEDV